MRLIWCTDIHLDHCKNIEMFCDDVLTMQPDRVLLTGDISNAQQITIHLKELEKRWDCPIDFVLGNHDYYGDSSYIPSRMNSVRKKVDELCKKSGNLNWLEHSGPIRLTGSTILIGSSLWCDWRAGLKDKSSVWLNDYLLIADLFGHPTSKSDVVRIKRKVRNLANYYTEQLMSDFKKAVDLGCKTIIVGVHVPPFHEASFYNGVIQDNDWAPHFVCKTAGDELLREAKNNPQLNITILCGHTHGFGKASLLPNLHIINGGARYGHPEPQTPIII